MKPVAVAIDTTCRNIANLPNPGGFRIKYACACCNEVFPHFLTEKYPFCPMCGHHIDWRVITHLNSHMSDAIQNLGGQTGESLKHRYVLLVNDLNSTKNFDSSVYIMEGE